MWTKLINFRRYYVRMSTLGHASLTSSMGWHVGLGIRDFLTLLSPLLARKVLVFKESTILPRFTFRWTEVRQGVIFLIVFATCCWLVYIETFWSYFGFTGCALESVASYPLSYHSCHTSFTQPYHIRWIWFGLSCTGCTDREAAVEEREAARTQHSCNQTRMRKWLSGRWYDRGGHFLLQLSTAKVSTTLWTPISMMMPLQHDATSERNGVPIESRLQREPA